MSEAGRQAGGRASLAAWCILHLHVCRMRLPTLCLHHPSPPSLSLLPALTLVVGFARGTSSALTRGGSSATAALSSSSSSSSSSSGEGMSYFLARSAAASALEPGLYEGGGRGGEATMC